MLREKQYAHLQSSKPPVELQRWKRASNIRASSFIALSELQILLPACWSSGNTFVSGAGGPRFKSRAGQIKHSVAHRRNDAEVGPANWLHASA